MSEKTENISGIKNRAGVGINHILPDTMDLEMGYIRN